MTGTADRSFALVGPGRAGTAVALGLLACGWRARVVAGRAPQASSTVVAAATLGAETGLVSQAGHGVELVVISTPDGAITNVARTLAPSVETGALVVHLAGSAGLELLAPLAEERPDVRLGALHPLQTLPDARRGLDRLAGSWAAVAGDSAVGDIARELGLRPFELADDQRALYHATAVVASNHLVALIGQVERLADQAGVPFEAFWPLIEASLDNVAELGVRASLTGPVARGDFATVDRHLAALAPSERDSYRAMAREAARLAGHRAGAVDRLRRDG